jgi:hypothetical protein
MPIEWIIREDECLVDAVISGSPTLQDFKAYIADVTAAGGKGHAKLVDMRHAALDLRSADIRAIALAVIAQAEKRDAALGPVALIVDAESSLEFCMLFDRRTEHMDRPLAIFADRQMALAWLRASHTGAAAVHRRLAKD